MVKENCGVVGIYSEGDVNVIPMVIDALRALQHRGQEAWGLAIPNKAPLKRLGLVSASSNEFKKITEEYASHSAIGHVRYSTVGKSDLESAQPLKVKDLCVAHNGTISNVEELSNLVGGCTFTPQNASDTLVAAQRLVSLITENGKLGSALSILKNEMVGSFCFTFLSDDDAVFAARDPKGFRPMVMGHKEDGNVHIVTSESSAISAIGAKLVRDVVPGELIKISKDVCLNNTNVKLVSVGSGIHYSDHGPTHHTTEDLAILKSLPNIKIISPSGKYESNYFTRLLYETEGPFYLRLGRGKDTNTNYIPKLGNGQLVHDGKDITIFATGSCVIDVYEMLDDFQQENIDVRLINIHTIKPIDNSIILKAADQTSCILVIEEHQKIGGLADSIANILMNSDKKVKFSQIGIDDKFCIYTGSKV